MLEATPLSVENLLFPLEESRECRDPPPERRACDVGYVFDPAPRIRFVFSLNVESNHMVNSLMK